MSVVQGLCFIHVIDTYLCTVALTYGPSMLPTLSLTGNIILADRISPGLRKVGRGDIVILRSPVNPRRLVTKRIIGVEGDSITYVIDPNYSDKTNIIMVPKGHVWVQGDNPFDSKDSRNFGAVPFGLLEIFAKCNAGLLNGREECAIIAIEYLKHMSGALLLGGGVCTFLDRLFPRTIAM